MVPLARGQRGCNTITRQDEERYKEEFHVVKTTLGWNDLIARVGKRGVACYLHRGKGRLKMA